MVNLAVLRQQMHTLAFGSSKDEPATKGDTAKAIIQLIDAIAALQREIAELSASRQ